MKKAIQIYLIILEDQKEEYIEYISSSIGVKRTAIEEAISNPGNPKY